MDFKDMFKNGMGDMLKQAEEVQTKMKNIQDALMNTEVVGDAGAGSVKVFMNGRHQVNKIEIGDDELLDIDEKDVLQDLIKAAVNSAIQKVEKLSQEKMLDFTKGLGIPPDFKLPTDAGNTEGTN